MHLFCMSTMLPRSAQQLSTVDAFNATRASKVGRSGTRKFAAQELLTRQSQLRRVYTTTRVLQGAEPRSTSSWRMHLVIVSLAADWHAYAPPQTRQSRLHQRELAIRGITYMHRGSENMNWRGLIRAWGNLQSFYKRTHLSEPEQLPLCRSCTL